MTGMRHGNNAARAPQAATEHPAAAPVQHRVDALQILADELPNPPKLVYVPCCATDTSPSSVFKGSDVVYAEMNPLDISSLKKAGVEAHETDATQFNPGDVNLLILINPMISPAGPAQTVQPGGHIICNDYHGSASWLRQNPDYVLRGMVTTVNGAPTFVKEAEGYWQTVDSEEDFKTSKVSFTTICYPIARRMIETIDGEVPEGRVLGRYLELVEEAREQARQRKLPCDGSLMYEKDGRYIPLETELPRKIGTSDSFFLFEKKLKLRKFWNRFFDRCSNGAIRNSTKAAERRKLR